MTVENITQIKSGKIINVGVSAKIRKNIKCAKKTTFGIALSLAVKMVNIDVYWRSVDDDSVTTCDHIVITADSVSTSVTNITNTIINKCHEYYINKFWW